MENQATLNPDRRPLPDGWVQHYEPAKQIWYYVQIAIAPPTVSFVHPADLMGGTTVNRATSPTFSTAASPQFPNPTVRQSPNGHTSMMPHGMTIAQKLYASSANSAATAPMISSNSITSLSTSVDAASSPSPPPASNRASMLPSPPSTSPLGSDSPRPLSYLPQSRHGVQNTRINLHNNRSATAVYGSALEPSHSYHNMGDHNPHRVSTVPAFPKATTLHSQSVGTNSYSNVSGPRPRPNLLTKAKPPVSDIGTLHGKVDFATSPAPPLSLQSTSPPSASLLFSKPAENVSPSSYIRPGSSISPHNVPTYNHLGLNQGNQTGRLDTNLGTSASGLGPTNLLAMLKSALSMSPIAESELRAVAYGELNANYQAVLSALKQQLRYRPTSPTQGSVDYQLLIIEVGRLEMKATLVQQSQQQAQQAQVSQQQQMALDAFKKQQEAVLAQQQQQHSVLNQQSQQQALLNSQLQQQQNATLAQQQALLHQQAQEQAMLKLQMQQQQQAAVAQQQEVLSQQAQEQAMLKLQMQQQQQAALAQQQAIMKKQAEEQAALELQLQQQKQQMLAQQQAVMQANRINQQQLHTLQQQQTAQQQLLVQQSAVHHPQASAPPHHQGGQQKPQQQQQSGLGSFMSSAMGGGPQQQSGGHGQFVSQLVHSVVDSLQQQGSDPSASSSSGDAGNVGLMDSVSQSLNNFNSGCNGGQDPSSGVSGLFGGSGNIDFGGMFSGNMDFSGLTSNVDFAGIGSGIDFSSFGSNEC